MLWSKLVIIASGALSSTAAGSVAKLRADAELMALTRRTVGECVAVAASEGGVVDGARILQAMDAFPVTATSSLQRDLESGRETELDYLSGPVIRRGEERGIDVSAMKILDRLVRERQRSQHH
jgi:2-dehydropantoate 2-reductase